MASVPRFDKLWHEVLTNKEKMVKSANSVGAIVKRFRREAYRFAKALVTIEQNYHNELLDQVTSGGLDLAAWMDDAFAPIEAMGDTRQRLMAAIEQGCSEKDYVAEAQLWIVRKRVKVPSRTVAAGGVPDKLPETATIEERLEHALSLVESLRSQVQGLKAENRELRRDNGVMLREIDKAKRSLGRVVVSG